jgi:hypothetical protein
LDDTVEPGNRCGDGAVVLRTVTELPEVVAAPGPEPATGHRVTACLAGGDLVGAGQTGDLYRREDEWRAVSRHRPGRSRLIPRPGRCRQHAAPPLLPRLDDIAGQANRVEASMVAFNIGPERADQLRAQSPE